jgi:hypothetical protein
MSFPLSLTILMRPRRRNFNVDQHSSLLCQRQRKKLYNIDLWPSPSAPQQQRHLGIFAIKLFRTSGLYYKPMMIVNDDSRVITKLENSLTDNARVIIYDRHMFIVQATEFRRHDIRHNDTWNNGFFTILWIVTYFIVVLDVFILNIISCAECYYAEYAYAECCYAECHYDEYCYSECFIVSIIMQYHFANWSDVI